MTEHIKQRFDGDDQRKDCFLCCAAMAASMTYDEAWAKLDDELRSCFGTTGRGPQGDQCDKVLKALGFDRVYAGARSGDPNSAPGDYWVLFIMPEYATRGFLRNMLWGRRALIQVRSKNYVDEHHIIYWDGHGLFDPSNKRAWEWHEVEPIYLWLFDERSKRFRYSREWLQSKLAAEMDADPQAGPELG